jgi:hypothetical protein
MLGRGLGWREPSNSGSKVGLSPTFSLEWVFDQVCIRVADLSAVYVAVWVLVLVAVAAGSSLACHPVLHLHTVRPPGLCPPALQYHFILRFSLPRFALLYLLAFSP